MAIKVLHVVGAMNMGGTETMLMNLFRNIDREKYEFHFVSFSDKNAYYDHEIKELGGKIIHMRKSTSVDEFRKVMRDNGPYSVVHAHTLFNCGIANLAARLEKVPIRIAHAHTTLDENTGLVRGIYIRVMRGLINRNSTHLLACSQTAGNYLFGAQSIKTSKYNYLPNMIDYSRLLERNNKDALMFKEKYRLDNKFVIGHIGRMTEAKNHKFLIELIDSIKDVKPEAVLLLVGDGELKPSLQKLVEERHLQEHVIFTGLQKDVSGALYNMDVFVFPSIYEGLGLVLLEAQLCGLPCIVSEAIQPEADLKMGLMNKVSLNEDLDNWVEVVFKQNKTYSVGLEDKKKALYNQGYTKEQIINQLLKIYQGECL